MAAQMSDPHIGMLSFQQALLQGILKIDLVPKHKDLYSHFDVPAPGVSRCTYVRLSDNRKKVKAFFVCTMNGEFEGLPCLQVGYATPEDMRQQGYAKQILKDAIQDQLANAGRSGLEAIYIELVIDVDNVTSQRVAESIFNVERESIVDSASGKTAYRYTQRFDTPAR